MYFRFGGGNSNQKNRPQNDLKTTQATRKRPQNDPSDPENDLKTTSKRPQNDLETTSKRPQNDLATSKRPQNDLETTLGQFQVVFRSFSGRPGRFQVVSRSFCGRSGRFQVDFRSIFRSSFAHVGMCQPPRRLPSLNRAVPRPLHPCQPRLSNSSPPIINPLSHPPCFQSFQPLPPTTCDTPPSPPWSRERRPKSHNIF